MTDPQQPRGAPRWVNVLLIVVAVLVIAVGVCIVGITLAAD